MQTQSQSLNPDNASLKDVYPDVERRKKYATKRLQKMTYDFKNPFVVRVQPSMRKPGTQKVKYVTFTVPGDCTIGKIITQIKKLLNFSSKTSLFIDSGNKIIESSMLIAEVAKNFQEQDGIIYLRYTIHMPFGGFLKETEKSGINFRLNQQVWNQAIVK